MGNILDKTWADIKFEREFRRSPDYREFQNSLVAEKAKRERQQRIIESDLLSVLQRLRQLNGLPKGEEESINQGCGTDQFCPWLCREVVWQLDFVSGNYDLTTGGNGHDGVQTILDRRGENFVYDRSVCPCLGPLKGTVRKGHYSMADGIENFLVPGLVVSFPAAETRQFREDALHSSAPVPLSKMGME